jgi:hypothetical protein
MAVVCLGALSKRVDSGHAIKMGKGEGETLGDVRKQEHSTRNWSAGSNRSRPMWTFT